MHCIEGEAQNHVLSSNNNQKSNQWEHTSLCNLDSWWHEGSNFITEIGKGFVCFASQGLAHFLGCYKITMWGTRNWMMFTQLVKEMEFHNMNHKNVPSKWILLIVSEDEPQDCNVRKTLRAVLHTTDPSCCLCYHIESQGLPLKGMHCQQIAPPKDIHIW